MTDITNICEREVNPCLTNRITQLLGTLKKSGHLTATDCFIVYYQV